MESQYISYIVVTLSIIACITIAISAIVPMIEEWRDVENQRKALSILTEIDSSIVNIKERDVQTLQLNAPSRVSLSIKKTPLLIRVYEENEIRMQLNYSLLELVLVSMSKSIEENKPWFSSHSFVEVSSHTPLIILSRIGSIVNMTYIPKITLYIREASNEILIEVIIPFITSNFKQVIIGGLVTVNLRLFSTWNWSISFNGNALREIIFETSFGNFSIPLYQSIPQPVILKVTLYTVEMEVTQH